MALTVRTARHAIALSAPRAWMLTRQVAVKRGRELNQSLADTGQLVLLFGVLYSIGLVVSRLVR